MPQAPSPCHLGRQSRPIFRAFKSFSELSGDVDFLKKYSKISASMPRFDFLDSIAEF